jgi:hypothetical protein
MQMMQAQQVKLAGPAAQRSSGPIVQQLSMEKHAKLVEGSTRWRSKLKSRLIC